MHVLFKPRALTLGVALALHAIPLFPSTRRPRNCSPSASKARASTIRACRRSPPPPVPRRRPVTCRRPSTASRSRTSRATASARWARRSRAFPRLQRAGHALRFAAHPRLRRQQRLLPGRHPRRQPVRARPAQYRAHRGAQGPGRRAVRSRQPGRHRQPRQQGAAAGPRVHAGSAGRQLGPAQLLRRPERGPQRQGQRAPERGPGRRRQLQPQDRRQAPAAGAIAELAHHAGPGLAGAV